MIHFILGVKDDIIPMPSYMKSRGLIFNAFIVVVFGNCIFAINTLIS